MAIIGSQVTVATSATLLVDGTNGTVGSPIPASITNQDVSASVYLGGSGVTTSGYELKAGRSAGFDVVAGDVLYACTSASTVRVDVLKGRQ